MTRLLSYKRNLLMFIAGIFILTAAGFLLAGCGAGPQSKVTEPETGNYAVEFSTTEAIRADILQGLGSTLMNKSVTLEAWFKTTNAIATSMAIVSRGSTSGAVLFLDSNANCGRGAGVAGFAVADDAYVCSTVATGALNNGAWHHVAGVIAMQNHNGVHADCTNFLGVDVDSADAGGLFNDEQPHLDLYVDGVYQDCAAPAAYPANIDVVTSGTYIAANTVGSGGGTLAQVPGAFVGTVDEVRIWGIIRTESEIRLCKGQELSNSGGSCGIDATTLHGYYKLDEGSGHKATDFSGRGVDGTKYFISNDANWDAGWVSGYPF